ncbi:GNAT family N-acetyltransferase [Mucilaginibacter sp. X5P1]|uniref:GNAT family N-acetyltransferase n=1 Tax=Mucilaginibacter sp. X5P1 TaxID=2723088 RepID=UPI0016199C42|nr:ribosomal protein S18 acetylase RimI-like enzyme [Mucilaginibacter sp. X5P1]
MEHILDNLVWNALNSGNKDLANGNENVKYFAKEVSPFVGLKETSDENFQLLYDTIPFDGFFGFVSNDEVSIPAPWKIARHMKVLQMVFDKPLETVATNHEIIPLGEHNVPEMLTLTQLTNPGPFATRTIDFGHYRGIFKDNNLVAMAGQRMNPYQYAEISAVCTHPDHLGKSYAKQLLLNQMHRIKEASGIPFLHVLAENIRAINVYETLGFETRKEISIYIIQKDSATN